MPQNDKEVYIYGIWIGVSGPPIASDLKIMK